MGRADDGCSAFVDEPQVAATTSGGTRNLEGPVASGDISLIAQLTQHCHLSSKGR